MKSPKQPARESALKGRVQGLARKEAGLLLDDADHRRGQLDKKMKCHLGCGKE
jgi:hypothetical protein